MNKIYLLMEATGSWEDYYNSPIEAFTSRELAEKAAIGLNARVQELRKNAPKEIIEYYEDDAKFFDNVDEYWCNTEFGSCYDLPSYSVMEVNLIN